MTKKISLYDINENQIRLISEIESMDGEITPEIESALVITKSQLKQKSIAYLEVIKTKEAMDLMIDNEIKRLQALKKRNGNITTRLKDNLLVAVKTFGDFEIGTQKFGTRKSSQLIVEDVNILPEKFRVKKVTITADKKAIKDAIKSGEKVKGCSIKENQNLKIN